jgi:hypothetical protein
MEMEVASLMAPHCCTTLQGNGTCFILPFTVSEAVLSYLYQTYSGNKDINISDRKLPALNFI